jgi:S-DNA-T family DNA segregation ATPase FtsK/SpoIIIE
MAAHCTPKGYPIMKDGVYRIEVQTKEIDSPAFADAYAALDRNMYMPVSLGTTIDGKSLSIDLNSLPNLLIGGIPGAGKSMLLHSVILSLMSKDSKIYLIDPKMVEFGMYDKMRSIESIENTAEEAGGRIESIRKIMESRFLMLKKYGCRNVHEFNSRANSRIMRPIVLIIDEWADIFLQDKRLEKPLCFVAQKGRAAGVSVVLATQRPSSKVISGLVKANFSGRIALKTASAIDSRVILDKSGAEKILDIGTGIYSDHLTAKPVIFRAPYIRDIALEARRLGYTSGAKKPFWRKLWL